MLFLLWKWNQISTTEFGDAIAFVAVWVWAFCVYRLFTLKFQPKKEKDEVATAILALVQEMKKDREERNSKP